MNLRTKLTLILAGFVLLPGIGTLLFAEHLFRTTPTPDAYARVLPLAHAIEEEAVPLLATGNIAAVDSLFERIPEHYPEIERVTLAPPRSAPPITGAASTDPSDLTYPLRDIGALHITLNTPDPQLRKNLGTIVGFLLICLSLAGIAGLSITTRLLAPIKNLSTAAHQLSLGNFNARANISTGDELEELADVFNKASSALGNIDAERKQIDTAKTRFLSITSHELRSPMTPMKAQLQMLEQGYFGKLTASQRDSVSMVLRNADRLDTIIADFLEISRIEAARLKFTFQTCNLAETVKETATYMKGFMPEKNITIQTTLAKLPALSADPNRVAQILRNLLSNAIKFSPNGNRVIVSAKPAGDYIHFSVQDFGIGISAKDQLKLFEPFYQAEQTIYRERAGVGLGLAICRGIVLSQNGKIWIESKTGKGTTVHFTIPKKPVLDIKPIRVLFSGKEQTEKKLHQIFSELLGPIGPIELAELEGQFTLESLHGYVDDLHHRNIIDKTLAEQFKHRISHAIMGTESEHPLP